MLAQDWILRGGLAAVCGLAMGCVQTRITEPERTAVEQLLISSAADEALEEADLAIFRGRRVYVETAYFEGYDKGYVLGGLRDHLSRAGALLAKDADSAEVVLEPRAGALSTDSSKSLIGFPETGLPAGIAGSISTPEIALFKSEKNYSVAKIALFAYDAKSRGHLYSAGPLVGRAHHHYYTFLGYIKYTSTTIPEKKSGFIERYRNRKNDRNEEQER